jgi:hypothetical protein
MSKMQRGRAAMLLAGVVVESSATVVADGGDGFGSASLQKSGWQLRGWQHVTHLGEIQRVVGLVWAPEGVPSSPEGGPSPVHRTRAAVVAQNLVGDTAGAGAAVDAAAILPVHPALGARVVAHRGRDQEAVRRVGGHTHRLRGRAHVEEGVGREGCVDNRVSVRSRAGQSVRSSENTVAIAQVPSVRRAKKDTLAHVPCMIHSRDDGRWVTTACERAGERGACAAGCAELSSNVKQAVWSQFESLLTEAGRCEGGHQYRMALAGACIHS